MAINILIFGPTGGVASYAVQYAASKGANVVLAMRDTSKSIPGLSSTQEASGNFTRVQADLTDPASVKAAASKVPIHSAFIYLIHGPQGTPKASIQALKDAGVKHVVFLSSISVIEAPLKELTQESYIPWAHAQVELRLQEVYGKGEYTAVRPAWFATNALRQAQQIKSGVVKLMYPDALVDYTAPKDIGEVSASIMLREQGPLPETVYVCGPQLIRQDESYKLCRKAVGKALEVQQISEEEGVQLMVKYGGIPEPIAQYLAKSERAGSGGVVRKEFSGPEFKAGQAATKELLGRDAVTAEQWIEENKQEFA